MQCRERQFEVQTMPTDPQLIVSVSGIRGIVGQSFTPGVALHFATALGQHASGGKIVLSRDGRPSGCMLRHAILGGLLAAGCEVHDLGIAPTPTVGLAVRTLGAAGGIQITASHNSAEWNGLKLFSADGRILGAADGRKVQARFEANEAPTKSCAQLGSVQDYRRAEDDHRDRILPLVDVPRIRAAKLWAFVDANGGAGGPLARKVLHALQVQTFAQGDHADGNFLHEPEPTAENLCEIGPIVRQHGAHIGFALDPDADRLALLDEQGRYIGEELTLALAVQFRLSRERGPVVVNMSTSRVVEDLAAKYGCPFHRSAVGEANVADCMIAVGAVIGGEGNGGVIDPRVGLVRDPFIGMALILNLLAETGKKLSELVAELSEYHIVKDKYTVDREQLPALFSGLQRRWPDAKVNALDGLRWTGRIAGCMCGRATPSRLCGVIAEAPRRRGAGTVQGCGWLDENVNRDCRLRLCKLLHSRKRQSRSGLFPIVHHRRVEFRLQFHQFLMGVVGRDVFGYHRRMSRRGRLVHLRFGYGCGRCRLRPVFAGQVDTAGRDGQQQRQHDSHVLHHLSSPALAGLVFFARAFVSVKPSAALNRVPPLPPVCCK